MALQIEVLKFGGTSQKKSTYDMIFETITSNKDVKYVIVLSAIKGITNKLIEFVESKNFSIWKDIIKTNEELIIETLGENNTFIKDMQNKIWDLITDKIEIVAMGEFFTTNLLNDYLNKRNIKSVFLSSFDVIKSNENNNGLMYNKGEFKVNDKLILDKLKDNQVIIIPGFSGSSLDGLPCLLGRGGSDTSGSIIASAINAKTYEIWTDVDGIFSSDPRVVKNTHIIDKIGYLASQEIAAMGAKVIHPYCILPCFEKNIPIIIKNTFNPKAFINTVIYKFKTESNCNIYGVTIQNNVKVFNIKSENMWNNYGFVYDIFSIFKKYNVDVNIINTSQFSITTTTDDTNIENLLYVKNELEKKYTVDLTIDNVIVSVVGENIKSYDKIGDLFNLTKLYDIVLTSYSSNDMSISWVLKSDKSIELANKLHNIIF